MDNIDVVRAIERAWDTHDEGALDSLIAPDFQAHTPGSELLDAGLEGAKNAHRASMQAMPDMRAEVIRIVASGKKVAVHARYSGTDTGGFMPGMPPTGKRITMDGIDISEIDDDGKQVSHYGIQDTMAAMMQLGLMTPPGGTD